MNDEKSIQLYTRPTFPPRPDIPAAPQLVSYGSNLYQLVPPNGSVGRQVDIGWLAFAGSVGLLLGTIAGGLLMFMRAETAPAAAPQVIEKPVAVPQTIKPNCVMFCGDQ